MPAKPLTPEQKQDAARLKAAFRSWQATQRAIGWSISQLEAASRLGFGQSALSQYLNGVIPLNGPVLSKFCELIGAQPEEISPAVAKQEAERSHAWVRVAPTYSMIVSEPEADYAVSQRPIWVVGTVGEKLPEKLWGAAGFVTTSEQADVASQDPHAFVCRISGDSMAPRFMPGEYALVEPGTPPDIEDDVLVRLNSGETMLMRLLSRRGGVRLGTYQGIALHTLREQEISWIYYVSHPIPARKIKPVETNRLRKPRAVR